MRIVWTMVQHQMVFQTHVRGKTKKIIILLLTGPKQFCTGPIYLDMGLKSKFITENSFLVSIQNNLHSSKTI